MQNHCSLLKQAHQNGRPIPPGLFLAPWDLILLIAFLFVCIVIFKASFSTKFFPKACKLYQIFSSVEKKFPFKLTLEFYSIFSSLYGQPSIVIISDSSLFTHFSVHLIVFHKNYIQRGTNELFDARSNGYFSFFIFLDVCSALKIFFLQFL